MKLAMFKRIAKPKDENESKEAPENRGWNNIKKLKHVAQATNDSFSRFKNIKPTASATISEE